MSLINKMLKDLEKRKSSDNGGVNKSNAHTDVSFAPKSPSFLKKYGHWILLVVIVAIFAFYFLPGSKKKIKPIKTQKVSAEQILEAQIAKVINSTWDGRDDGGTLTLYLSKLAHYQMKKISDTQIELTLFDVEFKDDLLPEVSNTDQVIDKISLLKLEKNTIIDIHLRYPGHVSVIELGQSSKSISIQVNITKPTIEKPKEEVSQSDEKTVVPLTREQLAEIQYNKIAGSISSGNTQKVVNSLNVFVVKYPEYQRAYVILATLQLAQGHKREALIAANKGLELNPTDINLIIIKGRILLDQGKVMKALAWLDLQSPDFNKYPEYYALKAMAELKAGSYVSAELYYSQLVQLDPSKSRWWLGLGLAFEQQRKLEESEFAYKRAIQTGNLPPALQAYVEAKLTKLWL